MDSSLVDSAWSVVAQDKSRLEAQKTVPISHFFKIVHELEKLSSSHPPARPRSKTSSLLSADAVEVVERLIAQNSAVSISKSQFSEILSDLLAEDSASSAQSTSTQLAAQRRAEAAKQRQSKHRSFSLYAHPIAKANATKQTSQSVPLTPDQKTMLTRQLSAYELQLQQLQENETRRMQHIEDIEHELDSAQSELVMRRQQQNAEFSKTRAAVDVIDAEDEVVLIQALFDKEVSAWDDVKDRINQLEDEKDEYLHALSTMSVERSGYLFVIDSLNQQLCDLRLEIDQLKGTDPTCNNRVSGSSSNNNITNGAGVRLMLAKKNASHYDFVTSLFAGELSFTYLAFAVIGACVVGLFLPFLAAGGFHCHNLLV